MKSCKKGYYYCNTDKKCKPIPEGSVVRDDGFLMKETLDKKDKPFIKKLVKKLRGGSKTHAKQADDLEQAMNEEGLRAWFGKSSGTTKSGRKVKGWVQVGGKYDGKPCARQPGQKTTPKCVSSSKRRSMSDKERDSAARRKRAADPNQPQKSGAAAPTMVSTDPKRKMKEEFTTLPLRLEIPKSALDFKQGLMFRESLDTDSGMLFVFDNIAQQSFHMTETRIPLDIAFIREDGIIESIKQLEPNNPVPVYSEGNIELAIEVNRGWFAENNVEVGDQLDVEYIIPNQREKYRSETNTIYDIISEVKDKKGKGSGTKDACYHKVKSRYSVWPSAYASGALVKCRRVGAANWGNSTKKEDVQWKDIKYKAKSGESTFLSDSDGNIAFEIVDVIAPAVQEAKVDTGRSDYGKASIRNYRRMGPGYTEPGMFDPEGKRGKTIEKRREEHKARRGVKGAKVPAYKVEEVEVVEDYETKKKEEIMGALKKRDLKQKVKEKIAADIIKRKGDVSKSDDRYAYESVEPVDEACWKGYEKKGMKKMFGKMYPNCVKKKTKSEEVEFQEKLDLKKADMGDVVKDFYKSDAPQFKGRSKEKRREMAIAAKLTAERGKLPEEVVTEVSKKTLGSYVKKAATEIGTSAMKGDYKKMQKRHKGVLDASDKMAKEEVIPEAKVDKGRSDYGKASIRNYRRMGPGHGEPGMFDPEGKRGKTIEKRREEHKARRGVKGAKVPAYKVDEGSSYGLYRGSGKASGAMKDYLDRKAKMLKKKRNKQSDAAKNNPHFDSTQPSPSGRNKYEQVTFQQFQEKCWAGYEKKGMKTMFGKRYPNCVKKKK